MFVHQRPKVTFKCTIFNRLFLVYPRCSSVLCQPQKSVLCGRQWWEKHMEIFGFDDLLQVFLFCTIIKTTKSAANLRKISEWDLPSEFYSFGSFTDKRVSSYISMLCCIHRGFATVFLLNSTSGHHFKCDTSKNLRLSFVTIKHFRSLWQFQ